VTSRLPNNRIGAALRASQQRRINGVRSQQSLAFLEAVTGEKPITEAKSV